jgi:hypothetical protein
LGFSRQADLLRLKINLFLYFGKLPDRANFGLFTCRLRQVANSLIQFHLIVR